ncbi:MAG: serine hydrolase [Bacteroidota bacterium]|jgi:CubicO group peptidase (beta-lactamase class C family)
MKKNLLFLFLLVALHSKSQSLYFPPLTGNTWDTISPATLGWCQPRIDSLYDFLESRNSKAFIVLKDGKIVLEKYFGTFTQDSLWYWASAGKTITAMAIGIAQQEGLLNINNLSSQYLGVGFSSAPLEKENLITVRNQLTMTSGFDDGVPDNDCTLDTCLVYLADAGTRWAYHNAPYTKLDGVVENASGLTLNQYVNQKISLPIGMGGTFMQFGYNNVYLSKTRGLARFGLLMLNRGVWNNNAILSDTSYFNQMTNTSQQINKSYGYLWWLNGKESYMLPGSQTVFNGSAQPNAPDDMYSALGKNGQIINVVPSQNLVMVRIGNIPQSVFVPNYFNDEIWQKFNQLNCSTTETTNKSKNLILLYPNPSSKELFIDNLELNSTIEIYNTLGELIYNELNTSSNCRINLENHNSGVYFIKIKNGFNSQNLRFLLCK